MKIIQGDKKIELDRDGFLIHTQDWNEDMAGVIARNEGIPELTKDQMEIIRFLRAYYEKFNFFPILTAVCKNIHQPKNCMVEQFINPLKAWKIAGLPNLGVISASSLDGTEIFHGFNHPG